MAEIERYDLMLGQRLYLCVMDDGEFKWLDRFYSTEFADTDAESLASEIAQAT